MHFVAVCALQLMKAFVVEMFCICSECMSTARMSLYSTNYSFLGCLINVKIIGAIM